MFSFQVTKRNHEYLVLTNITYFRSPNEEVTCISNYLKFSREQIIHPLPFPSIGEDGGLRMND